MRRDECLDEKYCCSSISIECDHMTTTLSMPAVSSCHSSSHHQRPDIECSEKYWGEILERTLSSNSIHALQRTYGHNTPRQHYNHHNYHNHSNSNVNSGDIFSIKPGTTNIKESNLGLYHSNSEPELCEHDLHDINCAKNKAYFKGFTNGPPDI